MKISKCKIFNDVNKILIMYIMRFLSIFKCKTKRNIKKRNRKTRKQIKKLSRGGGKYNGRYQNDKSLYDNCDALPDMSEANRFFKLKCYMKNGNDKKVDAMVNKLIDEYKDLNSDALQRGAVTKNTPFMNYIDNNYKTFSPFSKQAVAQIYTRFQEEAIPTMQYIS